MPSPRTIYACLVTVGARLLASGATAQPCVAHWESPFTRGDPDAFVTLVRCYTERPSGQPMTLVAGPFTSIGPAPMPGAARWDGERWLAMGAGVTGAIRTAFEFDDGSGPGLIVAGDFVGNGASIRTVARWRGGEWEALGSPTISGFPAQTCIDLVSHDDGGGMRLFGAFAAFGAPRVMRYDGAAWTDISGAIVTNSVTSLAAIGQGPARGLYVGGGFFSVGGSSIARVARWDGASWSALGGGQPFLSSVLDLEPFGATPETSGLYVLARVTGTAPIDRLLRFDGGAWTDAPADVPRLPMRTIALSGGERMFFADDEGLAAWDGVGVARVGPALESISTFDVKDGPTPGAKTALVGGSFGSQNGASTWWETPKFFAALEDDSWARVDNGLPNPLDCLAVVDLGPGASLLAAMTQGDAEVIVRLVNGRWLTHSIIPDGATLVRRIVRFDRGGTPGEPTLYATLGGGYPFYSVSESLRGLAKWDGATWSRIDDGLTNGVAGNGFVVPGWVRGAAVFDDGRGGGPRLYVGGRFTRAGAVPALNVASWDGNEWSPVGSGLSGRVWDMLVHDDGSGPKLYAARDGSVLAPPIVRWNGEVWESLPPPAPSGASAYALLEQTVSGRRVLVASGGFGVARWDGVAWERLRPLQRDTLATPVTLLASVDAPGEPMLVAAGDNGVRAFPVDLTTTPLRPAAFWSHARWQLPTTGFRLTAPSGTTMTITSLQPFDDGAGPALWIGGSFSHTHYTGGATGVPASNIVRVRMVDAACTGDVNADGVVDMLDLNGLLSSYATPAASSSFAPMAPGDCNLDGLVDFRDLNAALSAFGATCP